MPYYHHMMFLFPHPGLLMALVWLIFIALAYLVYKDAEKRGMNGLLWGVPVAIPWIGVIFLIMYMVLRETGNRVTGKTTPVQILDERYAKGELTREQYLQIKEDMKKPTA